MKLILLIALLLHFGSCFLLGGLSSLFSWKLNLLGGLLGGLTGGLGGLGGGFGGNTNTQTRTQVQAPAPAPAPVVETRVTEPRFTINNNVNVQQAPRPIQTIVTSDFNRSPQFSILSPGVVDLNSNIFLGSDFAREGSFSRVPTTSQINFLLSQGNVPRIRQAVNSLIASNNLGSAPVADSLQRILSGMRSIVNVYEFSRGVRNSTTGPYRRQLSLLRSELDGLRAGSPFSATPVLSANIRNLLDENDALQVEYATVRAEISDLQNQVVRTRAANINDDLGRFVFSRGGSFPTINELNNQIRQRQLRLNEIEAQIADNQFRMDNLRDQVRYPSRFGDLASRQRQADLEILISKLQNSIAEVQNESDNVMNAYGDFANEYPNVLRNVNNYYYRTFGVSSPVRQDGLLGYLNDVYRPATRLASRTSGSNLRGTSTAFDFRPIDYVNSDWFSRYGAPDFLDQLLNKNYESYNENFYCDPITDQLLNYGGLVQDIVGNVLTVDGGNGQSYRIQLGGCSRLESLTNRNLPQIGDFVYSRGKSINSPKYGKIYRASHCLFY